MRPTRLRILPGKLARVWVERKQRSFRSLAGNALDASRVVGFAFLEFLRLGLGEKCFALFERENELGVVCFAGAISDDELR